MRIRTGIRQLTAPRRVARAAAELPMGESARTLLGTGAPWFESWLEHTDHSDPFWDRMRSPDALDRVQVPVLLVGGWQDVFVQQTLQQYRHLRDRGVDVALTIGPWTHSQLLSKGLAVSAQETLDWLDTHLGGTAELRRPDAVRVYVTGEAGATFRTGRRKPLTMSSTCTPPAASARSRRPTQRHRQRSATTPPIPPRPSAARCCPPKPAIATTVGSRHAMTCSPLPAPR